MAEQPDYDLQPTDVNPFAAIPDHDLVPAEGNPFAALGPTAKGAAIATPPPQALAPTALTVHPKAWYEQPLPEGQGEVTPTPLAEGEAPKPGKAIAPENARPDPAQAAQWTAGMTGLDVPEMGRAIRGEMSDEDLTQFYITSVLPMLGGIEGKGVKAVGEAAEKLLPKAARALETHPAWIDQRIPTAKTRADLEGTFAGNEPTRRIVNLDAMKETPDLYEHNIDLVKGYPNMRNMAGAPTDQVARSFVEHVKNNLLWLYDQIPNAVRQRSKLWYDGGNKIVNQWADQHGIPDASFAGLIARLSPQMNWYHNVSLADRIRDTMMNLKDAPWTPEMTKFFTSSELNKPEYRPVIKDIEGKTLNQIDQMDRPNNVKATAKALWVRLHDQTTRPQTVPSVSPEGEFGQPMMTKIGVPEKLKWQTTDNVALAIQALESNGDRQRLSDLMGNSHKVRNFYNNLLDPNSPMHDLTADTHAVAAGLLRPLAASDEELGHNFGKKAKEHEAGSKNRSSTGIVGTYPLYAEAYRQAAQDRGILPREMQSITWEGIRGLFPEDWKNSQNSAIIDNIWRQYKSGKKGIDETRQRILDIAAQRDPRWFEPDWFKQSTSGNDEVLQGAANAPSLSESGAPGQAASEVGGRGGGRSPGAVSEEGLSWRSPLEVWRNYDWGQEQTTGRAIRDGGVEESAGASTEALKDDARRAAERAAAGRPKLIGLPDEPLKMDAGYFVPGPNAQLHDLAEAYMRDHSIPYNPPKTYSKVDVERAAKIAKAFEEMKHDPSDPRVVASYNAMIDETLSQYRALKNAGIKFEMIRPDMPNPYELTPRLASKDVLENKHLWFYPTSSGFGSDEAAKEMINNNPLLRPTGEYIDGTELLANDVFRIVHDIFGHLKDGNGFRAAGEENAWRSHSAMYSDLARPAMTSETRGQNSWLNFGPHGEKNRTAKSADTIYADQKIGLLPDWAIEEGRYDPAKRADGGRTELGIRSSIEGPIEAASEMAEHADMAKFEREARPSTNIEDNRAASSAPIIDKINNVMDEGINDLLYRDDGGAVQVASLEPDTLGPETQTEKIEGSFDDLERQRVNNPQPNLLEPRGGWGERGRVIIPGEKSSPPPWGSGGRRVERAHGGRVEPQNIGSPTPAQAKAGNYAKDRVHVHGLPLTIENAKGSIRRGIGKDGPWESKLPSHYGYIKGTVGRDQDHIDVYLGPHTKSPRVYIVDQINADTKRFDEHKIMLGFGSKPQAINIYRAAFSDGKGHERIGKVHEMTVPELRKWLESGDTTKPFVNPDKQKSTKSEANYRAGSVKAHCGICIMFRSPSSCTSVEGKISASAFCDFFKIKEG